MAKHAPELFKHRSTTQEFLFSHTDEPPEKGTPAALADEQKQGPLQAAAGPAVLLDSAALIQSIENEMGAAATLCAMAIAVDRTAEKPDGDESAGAMAAAVATLSRFCSTHDALLARIGRQRFACVFAHRTATEGRTLAEALLKALSASQQLSITIGLAAYPTVNYARRQIVENAEKALAHGAFYGPGTVTPFDAVSLNISGDRHYQAGDIDAAVEEFTKGLLIDPTDANLHNSLGVCYGVLKDYAKALTAFESADWLAPDDVMAVYNKGYVRLLQGDREQALACFLEADAREADVFEVVYHIGELYMEMDAPETARAYLEAATRANSRSAAVFRSLGACLDRLGLNKEAIQAYKSAVKINPDDAESLSVLGMLYQRRGESLDVATVLCEQSIRLVPDSGLFRHRLGNILLSRGRLDDALATFESAMALGHDSQAEIEAIQERRVAAKKAS